MPKGIYQHKPLSEEHKRRISNALKGKPKSDEHKKHLSGINNPSKRLEVRKKISEKLKGNNNGKANKGRKFKEDTLKKMSEAQKGEKSHCWIDGRSKENNPYSIDWTESLRRTIRERDYYICQLCSKPQGDRVHSIHHIDYNKLNSNPNNLITLCVGCNSMVNKNREYWTNYFQNIAN